MDVWLVLTRRLRKLTRLGLSWGGNEAFVSYAVACQAPLEIFFVVATEDHEAEVSTRVAVASDLVNGLRGDLGIEGTVTIKTELWH